MRSKTLAQPAFVAGSTGAVIAHCRDALGNSVIPTSGSWTLMSVGGDIINGKKDVPLPPGTSKPIIVLSGDDLVGGKQLLYVEATYNSTLGSDLPLIDWIAFDVITFPYEIGAS